MKTFERMRELQDNYETNGLDWFDIFCNVFGAEVTADYLVWVAEQIKAQKDEPYDISDWKDL